MTGDRDRDIEVLIRKAGARVAPSIDRAARVRAAAESAWRHEVRARRMRRWYWAGGAVATAAALLLVVRPFLTARNTTPPTPETTVAGRFAATGRAISSGTTLETGAQETSAVRLEGGGDLRLATRTVATLVSNRTIRLDRGTIYLDSEGATPGAFTVLTNAGVVRDIGTRFEVHVESGKPADVRVRVRDGAIQLERGAAIDRAAAGTELSVLDGRVGTRTIAASDAAWHWTVGAAPAFVVEGASLDAVLGWAAREGGFTIDAPTLTKEVRATVLHGSIAGLSVEDALMNVLPTCGLTARVSGGRVIIRAAQ